VTQNILSELIDNKVTVKLKT